LQALVRQGQLGRSELIGLHRPGQGPPARGAGPPPRLAAFPERAQHPQIGLGGQAGVLVGGQVPADQAEDRFGLQLVHEQHQGDQQRHRQQGQRERDQERDHAVPGAVDAFHHVDAQDDQRAAQPGGDPRDEPGPRPARGAA